jgi:predicted DNA-binding transcriptional regulator AlpA
MSRPPGAEPTTPADRLFSKKVAATCKRERVKSLPEVATLLDVSRNTVAKWVAEGMPVEVRSTSKGVPHQIDLAEAVRWLQRQAAAKGTERSTADPAGPAFAPPDGGEDREMALTRKARADADRAESEAAIKDMDEDERRGGSGPYGIFTDMVRAEYASLSFALSQVGPRLEERLTGQRPERIGKECDRLIRQAIEDNLKGQVEADEQPHPGEAAA